MRATLMCVPIFVAAVTAVVACGNYDVCSEGTIPSEGDRCVPMACTPGAVQSCYSGPPGTQDTGICAAGTQTCKMDGSGFGPCTGEALPRPLENCATPEDDDCDGKATCDGAALWSKAWGSQYTDSGLIVATDANDNVYMAGMIGGSWDFGGGLRMPPNPASPDLFLVKYDAAGNYAWDRVFQATSAFYDTAPGLAVDAAGGIYLTGGFKGSLDFGGTCKLTTTDVKLESSTYLAKLDSSGACVWARQFGEGEVTQYGTSVQLGSAGEIVLAGRFFGSITLGSTLLSSQGQEDAFVAKLDASGNPAWAKAFGGPETDYGAGTFDSQGGVVVYGSFLGKAVLDDQSATSVDEHDLFVGRYTPEGGKLWLKSAPGANYQRSGNVLVDLESDDIVLTGNFFGNVAFDSDPGHLLEGNGPSKSIFAVKLSRDGEWIWGKRYTGAFEEVTCAALDPLGNLALAGSTQGNIDFGGGVFPVGLFVAKLDKQGEHVWSRSYPGSLTSIPVGIAADTHGSTIVTGQFDGAIDFGREKHTATAGVDPCTSVSFGCQDGFVVKLGP
jgi:hypothetical protein